MNAAVPDLVEPILGWRSWLILVHDGEPQLRSVVRTDLWQPGQPFEAACALSKGSAAFTPHTPPSANCTCGVHAARSRSDAMSHLAPPSRRTGFAAVGRVALWGQVVEGERGWRAQWGYPTLLELLVWRDDRRSQQTESGFAAHSSGRTERQCSLSPWKRPMPVR